MDDTEQLITEVVDQMADEVEALDIERKAIHLGISPDELIDRVCVEVKARIQ